MVGHKVMELSPFVGVPSKRSAIIRWGTFDIIFFYRLRYKFKFFLKYYKNIIISLWKRFYITISYLK